MSAELNGDVGARADCVLSFSSTGVKHVSVSLNNVVPGDWDLSNNSAQTTIQIQDPIVKLATSASAWQERERNTGTETYSDSWSQYNRTYDNSWEWSNAYINGYTPDHTFSFPATQFEAKVIVDGNTAFDQNVTNLSQPYSYWYGYTCQNSFSYGMSASICSYSGTWTAASVQIYGTRATYYSKTVGEQCSWDGCTPYSYIDNETNQDGTVIGTDLGTSDQFALNLTDSAGTQFKGLTDPAAVQGFSESNPYNDCWSYWYYGYPNEQWCRSGTYSFSDKYVYAHGSGT